MQALWFGIIFAFSTCLRMIRDSCQRKALYLGQLQEGPTIAQKQDSLFQLFP